MRVCPGELPSPEENQKVFNRSMNMKNMKTQRSSLILKEDWVEVRSIGGESKVIGQLHIEIWMPDSR
jgi:hypothetical protein